MTLSPYTGKNLITVSAVLLLLFMLITGSVKFIDVKPIGPGKTKIGLAGINKAVRDFFGVNIIRYKISEVMGFVAIATAAGFGLLGFIQLIKTKNLFNVDRDIILLGVFYIVVMGLYAFFEKCVVNYRPIAVKGRIEASFPSSHTMVVVFVMLTAIYQFSFRLANPAVVCAVAAAVAVVTVICRLVSGAHWFTDIVAGIFLSCGLACMYTGLRIIMK